MHKFITSILVFSFVLTGCQAGLTGDQPIPVEPDGGIGDGAEPLESFMESEVEFVDIAYTCTDLNSWDETQEKVLNTTYTDWKNKLNELFPDLYVYDIGNLCELQDGTQFISFASMTEESSSQIIAHLDSNNEILNSTPTEVIVRTAGDFSAPIIELISSETLNFSFYHGDGPCMVQNHFEMNMQDFSYRLIDESTDCGDYN